MIYSEATDALRRFADATGIAVGETQAGKGALPHPHPLSLGGVGATGTRAANVLAREADVVIVVGSRLSDFTTASKTAFQHDDVRFIAINVAEFDAGKQGALPLVGDAREVLEELASCLVGYRVSASYTESITASYRDWEAEVDRVCEAGEAAFTQAQVIGAGSRLQPSDVIVCAAEVSRRPAQAVRARSGRITTSVRLSCMGYEIAGGLAELAAPERDVYVLVGDGSYLMMAEISTAVRKAKFTIVLLDNHGFASIGGFESVGSAGFGTRTGIETQRPAI